MSNALYRKYRPSSFDGIVGQEHIVQTLINQIRTNRVCHAYLFCGSRGVGKTSLARIFARAVNCQNQDSDMLPCGHCDICKMNASADGSMDIIEIDAASNNGVDDARELRETVKYLPASGKYRVYIIDEVHMLSTAAFNALLKTLEEPPEHAVFILATTESHKLPATVLSRCVRFDFRLVSANLLYSLLSKIFVAEGKEFEEDALRAIAVGAEGSVRDALSIADMCINLSSGTLTAREVKDLIGGEDEKIEQMIACISRADIKGALGLLSELAHNGMSMGVCCRQISACARDIIAVKLDESLVDTTLDRLNRLKEISKELSVSFLAGVVELFVNAEGNLRYAISPILMAEAVVIRACKLYSLDLNAIDERINRVERAISSGVINPSPNAYPNPSPNVNPNPSPNANPNPINSGANPNYNSNPNHSPNPNPSPNPSPSPNPNPNPKRESLNEDIPPQFEQNLPPIDLNSIKPQATPTPTQTPKSEITAMRLWGKLITFFRKNSTPKMFGALSGQDPQKVALKGGVLTIYANKENYLFFCDDAFKEEVERAMLSEGFSFKLAVEKDLSVVDIEKEVESLMNEFGKDKVNIITD